MQNISISLDDLDCVLHRKRDIKEKHNSHHKTIVTWFILENVGGQKKGPLMISD